MLETAYRNSRQRLTDLAATLTDEQLLMPVPATPLWTVHEVVAHMVGGAADVDSGRLDGAPSDAWTTRHVAERRRTPIDDLLAEWDRTGPVVEAFLTDDQIYGPNLAGDAICHEGDLREALGLPRVDRAHWQPFLEALMLYLRRQLRDSTRLLVMDEQGQQWDCGSGDFVTVLCADGYELLRAGFSRRSRGQVAAWDWTPTAPPHMVECFGFFGPRDDDQPVPLQGESLDVEACEA